MKQHKSLLRLILFFTVINFLAKMGGDGQLAVAVLSRTNGSQQALGWVQAAVSMGVMAGSLLMTWLKPAKNRIAAIYLFCGLIFCLGDLAHSLTRSVWLWTASAFSSYMAAAIMNVHLTVLMRENVPVAMQGRVFSARDTLQNVSIPLGLMLGGLMTDHVFEPFMSGTTPVQQWLSGLFGTGRGAGVALLFLLTGIAGAVLSWSTLWLHRRTSN